MAYMNVSTDVSNGTPRMVKGVPNILFIGSGDWATEMEKEHPGRVFSSLSDAINAVPAGDGSSTYGYYHTLIYVRGTHAIDSKVQIPIEKSGIKLIGVGDHYGEAGFYTDTDLTAGVPMIEVEAYNFEMKNLRLWSSVTQAGDCITVGVTATSGALYFRAENVHILGPNSGSYKTFEHGIRLKDAKYAHLKDVYVDVGTGATAGILCEAGLGNGREQVLENCHVSVQADTGDAVIPLKVNADQHYGHIIGGTYVAQSTADAIEIGGNGWILTGGGLAASENAVSDGVAPIDINGDNTVLGEFYVKQIGANTAAALATEGGGGT